MCACVCHARVFLINRYVWLFVSILVCLRSVHSNVQYKGIFLCDVNEVRNNVGQTAYRVKIKEDNKILT